MEESAYNFGRAFATADALERPPGGVAKLPDIFGAEVDEFVALPVTQKRFVKIQFWSGGRQALHLQPIGLRLKRAGDDTRARDEGNTVSPRKSFAACVAMQCEQETNRPGALDRVSMQLETEVAWVQAGDSGNTYPITSCSRANVRFRAALRPRPKAGAPATFLHLSSAFWNLVYHRQNRKSAIVAA